MASDSQKTKADPAPKSEAGRKNDPGQQSEAAAKDKSTSAADTAKAEAGETAGSPANYSRGEGQKPVTAAYKENWNAIFGKKNKKKTKKKER